MRQMIARDIPTPLAEHQIEAGGKALRQYDMAARITRPWEELPHSQKKKWRIKAIVVLQAAALAPEPRK